MRLWPFVMIGIAQHLLWGVLVIYGDPLTINPLTTVHSAVLNPTMLAGLLFLVAVLASWGLQRDDHAWWGILWYVPQQILLILAMTDALYATWVGHYADGTVVTRAHLLADQSMHILLCAFHGWALFDHARGGAA